MNSLELLAQTHTSSTWLTTIWLLSLGVTAGFVICLLLLGIGYALSRVPGLNNVFEKPLIRFTVATGITAVILLLCLNYFRFAFDVFSEDPGQSAWAKLSELLLFTVPAVFIFSLSLLALCSRHLMDEIMDIIKDGPIYWFSVVCISLAIFCVSGAVLHVFNGFNAVWFVEDPGSKMQSLMEYPSHIFPARFKHEIPPESKVEQGGRTYAPKTGVELAFDFKGAEIEQFVVISRNPMRIAIDRKFDPLEDYNQVGFGVEGTGKREVFRQFPDKPMSKLYVKNLGGETAIIKMSVYTQPEYPQVKCVYLSAIAVVCLFLFYIFQRASMPKISAISLSTFKTEVAQPLYALLLGIGAAVLIAFIYIPGNTFGEDIKILKDSGLTIILVFSIFMAVYAASKSLAEEIEGRTALTVLSKPVGRRQFILGKFLGIAWSVALMFVVLGVVFAICVAYKPIYDAKEGAREEIEWLVCFQETMRIIPGLLLGYMEVLVFVAISVVISTRLPIMANLMICFTIYVLGHLTPLMVQSSVAVDAFEPVIFIGQLIAIILPVLDHFNIQAAVSGDTDVPLVYLGWSTIYCLIYGTIALLLALIFFEDRDLA